MVTASLDFVCIRPATYENFDEGQLLQSVFAARGSLENTVFCLFEPDGKTKLSKSGRSPGMVFRSPERFLAELKSIGSRYRPKTKAARALPTVPDLRLALNVAACDSAPLVISLAKSESELAKVESSLARLAWTDALVGRLRYSSATFEQAEEHEWLKGTLSKLGKSSGFVIVEPNAFGTEAVVLAFSKSKSDSAKLTQTLERGLAEHDPAAKVASKHIAEGRREGIEWESEMPVSGPDEQRRKAGGKGKQRERKP